MWIVVVLGLVLQVQSKHFHNQTAQFQLEDPNNDGLYFSLATNIDHNFEIRRFLVDSFYDVSFFFSHDRKP